MHANQSRCTVCAEIPLPTQIASSYANNCGVFSSRNAALNDACCCDLLTKAVVVDKSQETTHSRCQNYPQHCLFACLLWCSHRILTFSFLPNLPTVRERGLSLSTHSFVFIQKLICCWALCCSPDPTTETDRQRERERGERESQTLRGRQRQTDQDIDRETKRHRFKQIN